MIATLISILVLGLLVIFHEMGHLLVARWAQVRVLRFSMGFGPRILNWKRGHTEYSLSAIPLGGYVKMAGEQHGEETHQPWEYLSKPVGVRALIVFAGPLVNYLLAFLSLWVVFVIGFPELLPVVGTVSPDMPAQIVGLKTSDRILEIEGKPVESWDAMTKIVYASADKPLSFVIEREGLRQNLSITPRAKQTTDPFGRETTIGLIGISPSGEFQTYRVGPLQAIGKAFKQQAQWVSQTMLALWSIVTGKIALRDSVTGPIGIVFLTSSALKTGLSPLLFLVSLFSLSLALFNLFPLPILDGGHLLFLGLEWFRGRPVSVRIQERSVQVGFVLLMTLVLVICVNDIQRFGLFEKLREWVQR
ncbi:MAG: RIP metalloprotease RseP [Candidatus Omnitrophica bacterium]|nr:RIP metalloprotease RseP [Candidatus Omnitrophota bacterium]MBI3010152.1 RIP metalloprotease RseP [Candidatus Omnitrophota bacterium]